VYIYDIEILIFISNYFNIQVVSGWRHNIVRGFKSDGTCVVKGWGRVDMKQLLFGDNKANRESTSKFISRPLHLKSLPIHGHISEIWCGSEYTVVSDEAGMLWSCGWNEHGNLGNGSIDESHQVKRDEEWHQVTYTGEVHDFEGIANKPNASKTLPNQVRLSQVWDSSLSCGGAHCLALISGDIKLEYFDVDNT
jgi:alpha-tubulin suppressor-like RCC1 family protein